MSLTCKPDSIWTGTGGIAENVYLNSYSRMSVDLAVQVRVYIPSQFQYDWDQTFHQKIWQILCFNVQSTTESVLSGNPISYHNIIEIQMILDYLGVYNIHDKKLWCYKYIHHAFFPSGYGMAFWSTSRTGRILWTIEKDLKQPREHRCSSQVRLEKDWGWLVCNYLLKLHGGGVTLFLYIVHGFVELTQDLLFLCLVWSMCCQKGCVKTQSHFLASRGLQVAEMKTPLDSSCDNTVTLRVQQSAALKPVWGNCRSSWLYCPNETPLPKRSRRAKKY